MIYDFIFSKADTDIFSIFSPSASSASTPTGPAVGGFPSPPINSINSSNAPSTVDVVQNTDKYSGIFYFPFLIRCRFESYYFEFKIRSHLIVDGKIFYFYFIKLRDIEYSRVFYILVDFSLFKEYDLNLLFSGLFTSSHCSLTYKV